MTNPHHPPTRLSPTPSRPWSSTSSSGSAPTPPLFRGDRGMADVMSAPPHLGRRKRPRLHLASSPAGTRDARLRDRHRSRTPAQTTRTVATLTAAGKHGSRADDRFSRRARSAGLALRHACDRPRAPGRAAGNHRSRTDASNGRGHEIRHKRDGRRRQREISDQPRSSRTPPTPLSRPGPDQMDWSGQAPRRTGVSRGRARPPRLRCLLRPS
jgi:hypothetical protein